MSTPSLTTFTTGLVGGRDVLGLTGKNLHVRVLTDLAAIAAVSTEWMTLESGAPAGAVFQCFAFTLLWAQSFIVPDKRRGRLRVALVYADGRPKFILPVWVTTVAGVWVGKITGGPIAQYSDAIGEPGDDLPACFNAAQRALRESGVDVLELAGLREDSLLARAAPDRLGPALNPRVAPYIEIGAWETHEAYLRSRSKNATKALRNRRNQLERIATPSFDVLEGGPAARDVMREALDLKLEWLAERGAMSSAFADPATSKFLIEIAEKLPGAVVHRMLIDGKPAAIRLGLEHGGTFFSYLSAYDPAFAQYSPGKMLMEFTISQVRARGLGAMDMLPPAGEHKAVWCDSEVRVGDYLLPLSLQGDWYAAARRHGLPAVRWAWHHLPPALRALVARRFLKA
jgi:CelD/BcsL family acetyltransferase involved in cellulose biosynthesis